MSYIRTFCHILAAAGFALAGNAEYDFVIVGGGTAGLALAARLSETASQSILVLEAGSDPAQTALAYQIPGADLVVRNSPLDWAFSTIPQSTQYDQVIQYHRGKGLGGSSLINGLAYVRGSSSVYDLWESMGNPGWGWSDVYPLFIKSSTIVPPNNDDETYSTYNASAYSNGPVQVGFEGAPLKPSVSFVKAVNSLGVPIVQDLNAGDGVGIRQGTGDISADFQRSSSYDNYYQQAKGRSNLVVKTLARVRSLTFDQTTSPPTATGVVYDDLTSGMTLNVTANKEVIMCAGAFQTPQLLLLSGIGPLKELNEYEIDPISVIPAVGKHMQDNPLFALNFRVQASDSGSPTSNDISQFQAGLTSWFANRSGPLTTTSGICNGFMQLTQAQLQSLGAEELITDGRADQAHLELSFETVYYPGAPSMEYAPTTNESYLSISAQLLAPTSRGSVTLYSNTYTDPPQINLNYFSTQTDQNLAVQGFKYLRQILATPEMQQYVIGPNNGEVNPGPAVQTDEEILDYIRRMAVPNWHACGTCRMLPEGKGGCVDSTLKVYGVQGLRVVDASTVTGRLLDRNSGPP